MASHRANINHELLRWGRQMSGMPLYVSAKKIGVKDDRLRAWEAGDEQPTINQLRKIANTYKQSFAAFFLSEAPTVPQLPLKDYRRLPGAISDDSNPSYEIVMDVRKAMNRRMIALDLVELNGLRVKSFTFQGSMLEDSKALAKRIRADLGVSSLTDQLQLKTPQKGFKYWRQALESIDILVFQSSFTDEEDMRGYSVFEDVFPIISVNRREAEHSRIFTLIHELTHLYLRGGGLCNIDARTDIPPEAQKLEQFCNDVAANVLIPFDHFSTNPVLNGNASKSFTEQDIEALAKNYCVSREVIARRLVEIGRVDKAFYRDIRDRLLEEYKNNAKAKRKNRKGGFIPPSMDVISKSGKVFSDLIIRSLKSRMINSSQASELFGVKLKHIQTISKTLGY